MQRFNHGSRQSRATSSGQETKDVCVQNEFARGDEPKEERHEAMRRYFHELRTEDERYGKT